LASDWCDPSCLFAHKSWSINLPNQTAILVLVNLENVEIIGAGPAGLYTAILLKTAMPTIRVRVSEQNPADATFGFDVVFSGQALDFLQADDPETHALITPLMKRWRNMTWWR
jgi:hypothetical protein